MDYLEILKLIVDGHYSDKILTTVGSIAISSGKFLENNFLILWLTAKGFQRISRFTTTKVDDALADRLVNFLSSYREKKKNKITK